MRDAQAGEDEEVEGVEDDGRGERGDEKIVPLNQINNG